MQIMEKTLESISNAIESIRVAVTMIQVIICKTSVVDDLNGHPGNHSKHSVADEVERPKTEAEKGKRVMINDEENYKTPAVTRKIGVMSTVFKSLLDDTDIMELSDDDDDGMHNLSCASEILKSNFDDRQNTTTNVSKGWDKLRFPSLGGGPKITSIKVMSLDNIIVFIFVIFHKG